VEKMQFKTFSSAQDTYAKSHVQAFAIWFSIKRWKEKKAAGMAVDSPQGKSGMEACGGRATTGSPCKHISRHRFCPEDYEQTARENLTGRAAQKIIIIYLITMMYKEIFPTFALQNLLLIIN